jgi:hypothetical protein
MVPARQATYAGGIQSLESIPGLHKRLKIRALAAGTSSTIVVLARQAGNRFLSSLKGLRIRTVLEKFLPGFRK